MIRAGSIQVGSSFGAGLAVKASDCSINPHKIRRNVVEQQNTSSVENCDRGRDPRFCVNIEGVEHPWDERTITTEQIAELGGWDATAGVIEVDLRENTERTLDPGEVVELRPGRAFCRKIRFRRGLVSGRHEAELAMLQDHFAGVEYRDDWFRIPEYPVPVGWSQPRIAIAFKRNPGHPAAAPYGIYVPAGLRVDGKTPSNYTEPASEQPPFGGTWGVLSWEPSTWNGATEEVVGWSLLDWARGFAARFAELN